MAYPNPNPSRIVGPTTLANPMVYPAGPCVEESEIVQAAIRRLIAGTVPHGDRVIFEVSSLFMTPAGGTTPSTRPTTSWAT